jgi:purine nucleoside phosphorylase
MASAQPGLTIGLIGGSGLLKTNLPALKSLVEESVDTAHGRVIVRTGPLEGGARLVFVQRHDCRPSRTYTQPADINYPAIALALNAKVRTSTVAAYLLL